MVLTRRAFLAAAGAAVVACGRADQDELEPEWDEELPPELDEEGVPADEGTLLARPGAPTLAPAPPGLHPLGLATGRDGLIYVPTGYRPDRPAPLVVMLHGAAGAGRGGIEPFLALADAAGLILVGPDSRDSTWDLVLEWYGPDVGFVDAALARVFEQYAIDPGRLAIGGFSDGASYALSLGITNGDLFSHVVAFSPGFVAPADQRGQPRLFVSHGTKDAVLPIDDTSRKIVPQARRAGFDVTYREFDGGHAVPEDVAREALKWLGAGP